MHYDVKLSGARIRTHESEIEGAAHYTTGPTLRVYSERESINTVLFRPASIYIHIFRELLFP